MSPTKTFVALAAGTMLIAAAPAQAQHRGGGGGQSREANGGSNRAAPRDSSPQSAGAPRDSAPQSPAAPRVYAAPRVATVGPRAGSYGPPRAYSSGQRAYRIEPRGGVVVGRSYPRVVGPRVVAVAPVRFYRPYYVFRPRFNVGFGLWAGFPIVYPYSYGYYDPYYYPYGGYPTAYPAYPYPAYPYPANPYPSAGYPPSPSPSSQYPPPAGSVGVQPGATRADMGGVSFEITPSTAEVFVDGSYVGTAGEFTPTTQPLGLTPGRHRIEIRAPGYRTMDFDVDIVAGQVIPYRGTLQP